MGSDDDYVALIDMDGTVADFDRSVREKLVASASPADIEMYGDPERWLSNYKRGERPDWLDARFNQIKKTYGFWEDLEPIRTGLDVVGLLKEMRFDLMVASKAPRKNEMAWTEKFRWCDKHLPDVPVTLTHNKALMYGKVLFDDWPPYIEAWMRNRPRGKVLMLDSPNNQNVEPHPNIMRLQRPAPSRSGQINAIREFLQPVAPSR